MNKNNKIHVYDNGLVLLAEEMNWSQSVAVAFVIPSGSVYDPPDKKGLADVVCEMSVRGAGDLDNRAFLQTLENLGIETAESALPPYTLYSAAMTADKLDRVLELYADLILRPRFPSEELDPVRLSQLQEVQSVEDEPSRKRSIELRYNFFPSPWGYPVFGTAEGLEHITLDDVVEHHNRYFRPNGTIISIAGRIDWEQIRDKIGLLFGDWKPQERPELETTDLRILQKHFPGDTAQTQIGLAWPTVDVTHPDYLLAVSGVHALSGGMSSRLFTEVREKRGLCYSVNASIFSIPHQAGVYCNCSTAFQRAQESLDVIIQELDRLAQDGIVADELARLKIMSKSRIVMQQESTLARAGAIARDWYDLKRIRSMEEIQAKVDSLTCEDINRFCRENPPGPMRLVTVGPEPLCIDEKRLG
ncbi:MAG: pitrilysin family protein [Planctomycetia bacterium]|nr:pitrilysin family protein [Planctomycetia bacterium]